MAQELTKMSDSGPDLAKQAKEHWETLQNDFDRWVRNVDKQLEKFQEDFDEIFDLIKMTRSKRRKKK